ncbi:MAG TPA: FMN-binding protein [Ignavibacteriaceae bacterium]|nr:FMN-binding protein [Ignavibacteriaceae bacterium]
MNKVLHIMITLTVIGVIAGGVLALVNIWAEPRIAANQKLETELAIFLVQKEGKSYDQIKINKGELYKVYDEQKNPIGYSLVYEGNGFQGKIRVMIGLQTDLNKITSIEILEQTETPGLGTKVTDPPYKNQYNGLVTSPEIKWVKGKPPAKPNEIQAITGATISSKSVVAIVNEGISELRRLKNEGKI